MTGEELEFAMYFGLSEEQLVIFKEIKEYFESYPELKTGNSIFAFEGLGDYTGGKNKYHLDGQYGAIFVYCKDGELNFLATQASTLPDNKSSAVIQDGIFNAIWFNHKGYSALQLRDFDNLNIGDLPALRNNNSSTADGIDLHSADNLTSTSNYSAGCLTISCIDYYYFGVEADFITEFDGEGDFENFNWQRNNLKTSPDKVGQEWGHVIVDRQFMSEKNWGLYFNEYK